MHAIPPDLALGYSYALAIVAVILFWGVALGWVRASRQLREGQGGIFKMEGGTATLGVPLMVLQPKSEMGMDMGTETVAETETGTGTAGHKHYVPPT